MNKFKRVRRKRGRRKHLRKKKVDHKAIIDWINYLIAFGFTKIIPKGGLKTHKKLK